MTIIDRAPRVAVDASNLCRDRRFLSGSAEADVSLLDEFVIALERSEIVAGPPRFIADRSLAHIVGADGRRILRRMEEEGRLEFSSLADQKILDLMFGGPGWLAASMDNFDDFRRTYPEIQGSRDRFIGWQPGQTHRVRIFLRDMGIHDHRRLSLKEESAELKARRLRRETLIAEATSSYFVCSNPECLLAQLWPDRLPDLPMFDDAVGGFVCSGCHRQLITAGSRPRGIQLIVFLGGLEEFRIFLADGDSVEVGRDDAIGRVGIEPRINSKAGETISRRHVGLSLRSGELLVEELGSRNGTVLRSTVGKDEIQLVPGQPTIMRSTDEIAFPSGITMQLSGRRSPIGGIASEDVGEASIAVDRSTRILSR